MRGFSLIDVLVGSALILIVFLGIFGAYQLGLRVIGLSQNKVIATALANQRLEEARNLSYQKVGIEGIDENGVLSATTYYPEDTQKYTILTDVDCRNNPADGPGDTCLCDYKTVTCTVSWAGLFQGEVALATDIASKNDIQECEVIGGVLEVSVFNAQGLGVGGAEVKVKDVLTGLINQCLTDLAGQCVGERGIFLDPSPSSENYKITVAKSGYGSDQTFATGELYDSKTIANPEKPNATILQGQITGISFSIDKLSTFLVETKSSWGKTSFDDEFNNLSKVSNHSGILLNSGEITLAKTNGTYVSSGYLVSTDISSPDLQGWQRFSWVDSTPANTAITYQFLYFDGADWVLIPDSDLPGNSTGLGSSPVDLSVLDCTLYDTLRAKATLFTTDPSQTPSLSEWHLIYFTRVAEPITASFSLRGEKIVGTDADENLIYKYLPIQHTIVHSGNISNLEWDTYIFSDFSISGQSVELEEGIPGQILADGSLSVNLSPDTVQVLTLYLATENTLLLKVKDSDTSNPIFSANVRLYNTVLDYEKTQLTDENGETFFIPLKEATYNLEVTAQGYETYTEENLWISGDSAATIYLILFPS